MNGISYCLTPKGTPWITQGCRLVSGLEALILQGIPVDRLELGNLSDDQKRDLAGNAMS